jgi:hypothetical protein
MPEQVTCHHPLSEPKLPSKELDFNSLFMSEKFSMTLAKIYPQRNGAQCPELLENSQNKIMNFHPM